MPQRLPVFVLCAALLCPCLLSAAQVPVRHKEGLVHGFLALRTLQGEIIADADLIQNVHGDVVTSRLVFHFKDGSLDDEITEYTQRGVFRLISDHHIQKGPSFPEPLDLTVDVPAGKVTWHEMKDGHDEVKTEHMDLPPDLANGMILTILKNISPDTPETKLSYVVATPKPRLVKLAVTPQGEDTLTTAGSPHRATQYVLKVELGGFTGLVAPLIGKRDNEEHRLGNRETGEAGRLGERVFAAADFELQKSCGVVLIGSA